MQPTIVDRATFLQNLQISKLLNTQQFRLVVDKLQAIDSTREIAKALVSWKLITKYQARMLLAGRNYGFFLGPYRILDVLGQGGMGRVYKALHQPMNREVALKVLSPQVVKTERAKDLFLSEVQAAAQLNHPNIVMAFDANAIHGRHFLAMEFVDGPNLEQYVSKNGAIPVGLACEIIFQAANGLQHAHERGLVHRDIKPANLLFYQPPGGMIQVKILDFGLARLSSSKESAKESTVAGTPDFLSPEQTRDLSEVDIRGDLYSLGCTFFYLLTGQVPFPGGKIIDKLRRHSTEMPPNVEDLRPGVSRDIADIVRKLLAKEPSERYQTPDDLMEALSPHASPNVMDWPIAPVVRKSPEQGTDEHPLLTPGQTDTETRAKASTQIGDEESILEWVDLNRKKNQRTRRLLWAAVIALFLVIGLGFGLYFLLGYLEFFQ